MSFKLVDGISVLIFPEGTRSRGPQMRLFKKGAFKLAFELDLDLLPITLVNSDRIHRKGFFNIRPGRTGLVIHPVIKTSLFHNDLNGLMEHARGQIASAL